MNEKTRISPTADPLADIDPAQRQGFDQQKIENAIREIIIAIGEDPDRDGLQDTPARVARAYKEMFSGLYQRPEEVLATTFDLNHNELVIVKNIDIFSVCEHHLLPIIGRAHVAYISNGRVIGLSKMNRIVEFFAKRPQTQERLTMQVVQAMQEALGTQDVACVIDAKHLCVNSRGIKDIESSTVTAEFGGKFKEAATKSEFLDYLKLETRFE